MSDVIPIASHPRFKEMRRHPRYELPASIRMALDGVPTILPAINISLGGVLVDAAEHDVSSIKVGSVIDVQVFNSSDMAPPVVRTPALVVRHEPHRVALSWTGKDKNVDIELGQLLQSLKSP